MISLRSRVSVFVLRRLLREDALDGVWLVDKCSGVTGVNGAEALAGWEVARCTFAIGGSEVSSAVFAPDPGLLCKPRSVWDVRLLVSP